MIEAWAKSEGKQIRLEEYVDRMKEDRKDIFAFPLNFLMLALNCMRGGLHGVSAPGQVKGFARGACESLVFHWPRGGPFSERKPSLAL